MIDLKSCRSCGGDSLVARHLFLRKLFLVLAMAALALLSACQKDANSLLHSVQALEAKGDYASAIAELTEGVRAEPKNGAIRYHLGRVYSLQFDWAAAEHEFRKATEAGLVEGGRVALGLGQALFAQRKYEEVISAVPAATAFERDVLSSVHALRGNALLNLDRVSEARKELAASPDSGNADVVLLRARMKAGTRDVDGALQLVEELLRQKPKSVDALMHRADLLTLSGKLQDALASLVTVIEAHPRHLQALIARSLILVHLGRLGEAQKDVDLLRQSYPKHAATAYLRGQIHYWRGEYREALDMAQRALKVDQEDAPARLLSGMTNLMLDAPVQAEHEFDRYLTRDPRNVSVWQLLMDLRTEISQRGRDAKALASIHADGLRKASSQALFGETYLRVWQYSKLATWFEQVARSMPPDPMVAVKHAKKRFLGDQLDLAVVDLERVVALSDELKPADTALVLAQLARGDSSKAMDAVTSLDKKAPSSPEADTLAGIVLLERKQRDESAQRFDEVLKRNPSFIAAVINRAQLDINSGKIDLARKRFEDALRADPDNLHGLLNFARFEWAGRRRNEAFELLNRAIKAHPKALEPMVLSLGLHKLQNDRASALQIADKLLAAHPDDPVALESTAEILAWSGDQDRAVATLKRLAIVMPRSAEAHYKLARAQFQAGLKAEADASLIKALVLPTHDPETQRLAALGLIDDSPAFDALESVRKSAKIRPSATNNMRLEVESWVGGIGAEVR